MDHIDEWRRQNKRRKWHLCSFQGMPRCGSVEWLRAENGGFESRLNPPPIERCARCVRRIA